MPSLHSSMSRVIPRTTRYVLICAATTVLLTLRVQADQIAQPTEDEVKEAVKILKQDPNLVDEEKRNGLHWVKSDKKDNKVANTSGWLKWLRNLFVWLAHTSRLLLWIIIGVAAAFVVVFLLRVFRNHQVSTKIPVINLPTHVRDLDIRPESLPDDIGAAVWQLWQQSEKRAALALLYRGLLSRLVHKHAVPIKDSSTESQCLQLARTHLQAMQTEYVSRALTVWQFAVYGAQLPGDEQVQQLCEQFSAALSRVEPHNMERAQ